MRSNYLKGTVKAASLGTMILLFGTGLASAQVTVNLTANRQNASLSDGNVVPMWGWTCGNAVAATPSTSAGTGGGTCSTLTGTVQTGATVWQPPLITVPASATSLTINLTNALPVETSLVIVGLAGGSLGAPVREGAPRTHDPQTEVTWTTNIGGSFTPPSQGARVRSFAPEAAPNTGTQSYTWNNPKPGTYLIETGTYPSIQGPMGLYGVVVVTTAPVVTGTALTTAGTAYPGVTYDADVALLLSEIDPAQNGAVEKFVEAVAGCSTTTPGTGICSGTIDATHATAKWTSACGTQGPAATQNTCYPAAVNYTPLYYLVNGISFSKDTLSASAIQVPAAASTGNVLLRFVNAGLRLHMPSVNNLSMSLIAEDANVLPEVALAVSKGLTPKPKIQTEVYLPAGKVHDVIVKPANNGTATVAVSAFSPANYQVFDRELSLSANASQHDSGMQAILQVAGGAPLTSSTPNPVADTYYCAPGVTLTVSDPGKGVMANDVNVFGVTLAGNPPNNTLTPFGGGSLTLNHNGTFTYTQPATNTTCGGTFTYYANGITTATAMVTISLSPTANAGNAPTANPVSYTSNVASVLKVGRPGALANDTDPNHYPLTAAFPAGTAGVTTRPDGSATYVNGGLTVTLFPDGSFTAVRSGCPVTAPPTPCPAASFSFPHIAVNSEKIASNSANVTAVFQTSSGLSVRVQDAKDHTVQITDYKWLIEQDRTFKIDPATQVNSGGATPVPSLATNFHTSYMPVIAEGCTGSQSCERDQTIYDPATGLHVPAVCEGSGICVPAPAGTTLPTSTVDQVILPTLDSFGRPISYYISILPGDAANPFNTGNTSTPNSTNCVAASTATGQAVPSNCGHTMGGAPITPVCTSSATGTTCTLPTSVTVNVEPNPLPLSQVTVYVFEDDNELNGEVDSELMLPVDEGKQAEPGLGDFQIELWDTGGSTGDFIGQMTYDMFNEPLTNGYHGTIDPLTGLDACPISNQSSTDPLSLGGNGEIPVGVIIVCPEFESDGKTKSPLVGRALIRNLMPGKYSVIAHPGAAREARGEEWLQTNTLDGTHYMDSFIRMGEPPYFQEFGPAGFHVFMGFVRPATINAHLQAVCAGTLDIAGEPRTGPPIPCNNSIKGQITNLHISRPPDERLYDSGVMPEGAPVNRATLAHTTCFVSLGVLDSPNLAFTKCDADGNFSFTGIPDGNYSVTVIDQWLDQLMFEKEISVAGGQSLDIGTYPVFNWTQQVWTNSYMDVNQNGVQDPGEPGLIQIPTRIRFRNGRFSNMSLTDIGGLAHFDETIPLFNWYTLESDTTRFKGTGVHVVNNAGGPLDTTGPYTAVLNSTESFSLPTNLRVPGAVYCPKGDAQCANTNFATTHGAAGGAVPTTCTPNGVPPNLSGCISTGRIDPGTVTSEGFQSFAGEPIVVDWGKTPYVPNENGGIVGHVVYSSTRPFDDPRMLFQNLWEPLVPGVTVNLYQENTAPDGTTSLTLVDTTKSTSWDDWAQGFNATTGLPNMNCPGQDPNDPYLKYTLVGSTNYLNPTTALPTSAQYKCYDGMHDFNQIEPAPYDGHYKFPSDFCAANPGGTITGTTIKCVTQANPANGNALLNPNNLVYPAVMPAGKYVVEEVTPPNYEIVKEEDKNILIGDQFIGYVTQQFGAISNIFIVPDQATVNNANPSYTGPSTATNQFGFTGGIPSGNIANPTTDMGRSTFGSFGPGGLIVQNAPCVGQMRIVPDFMSASPEGGEVAPFAGALRPLCDRKEITLEDQMQADADFFIFTKVPAATHFTGFILDDLSSEFDPNSPDFGEKFAVPNVPVSMKDYNGTEVSRFYSDQWGIYNGLVFSTWQVNPPNPTGYAPNVMVTCMNDPGPILDTRPGSATLGQMITDPNYNPQYSAFCYENPFMPGDTTYLDTPVVPIAAFAEGYNPPDCSYADATPAILRVDSTDGQFGPWVSGTGNTHRLTITALGDQTVPNHAYSGPAASTAPYNQKTIIRHYGFGSGGTVTITNPQGNPVQLGGVTWSDSTISAFVPAGVCPTAAQVAAGCSGELVITRSNGQRSVDTVTVTVGGNKGNAAYTPTYVNGENSNNNAIQSAIDAAHPGDLIIVNGAFAASPTAPTTNCATVTKLTGPPTTCLPEPGTYPEMLIMWKPVRLQGVGAASVRIDANPQHGRLDLWRAKVACVLGIGVNSGTTGSNGTQLPPGCVTGNTATDPLAMHLFTQAPAGYAGPVCQGLSAANPPSCGADSPLPDEASQLGAQSWNLDIGAFEVGVEPTLMAAEEGPGITALGFDGTPLLPSFVPPQLIPALAPLFCATNLFGFNHPANFYCAPSRIDGMSFSNSQSGGGIYAHGWNHNIEVSNNRVYSNGGTITGGMRFGQIEVPTSATDANGNPVPLNFTNSAKVHNNSVTNNVSFGDEFNVDTNAAGGGVAFCTGSDFYDFNFNWVCGNLSTGNGGGVDHRGLSFNGRIRNNTIIFNQAFNQTLDTHGGGIVVEGEPNPGPCGGPPFDLGCSTGLSDGSGNVSIDSNLIIGNIAEGGSGGGIRLENVNGADVARNQNNSTGINPANGAPWAPWWQISITNNIIANNEASWEGGGISLFNAVNTTISGNAVVSNDATATAGVLFDTVGANQGATGTPPPVPPSTGGGTCGTAQCLANNPIVTSTFQPAGLATELNAPTLNLAFGPAVTCPFGLPGCQNFSNPQIKNDIFWQNRSFHITVGSNPTPGLQNVITLMPQLSQLTTGACPTGANYWDIGINGDIGVAGGNPGGYRLNPTGSVVGTGGYAGNGTSPRSGSETVYCNGSRVPPEIVASICASNANNPACSSGGNGGHSVPPGIPDIDPFYPLFTLNPSATVDEGNNWINVRYGPLSLVNSSVSNPAGTVGDPQPSLGQYVLPLQITPNPLAFGTVTTTRTLTVTVTNPSLNPTLTGGFSLAFSGTGYSQSTTNPGSCGTATTFSLTPGASCTIGITLTFTSTSAHGTYNGTLTLTDAGANSPQVVSLSGAH